MGSLADLDRRLSRKLEGGKAIQLTPADLDLLVVTGAYAKFREAVAEEQREQCLQRNDPNRFTSGGNIPSIHARTGPILRLSGTMPEESESEALARARLISGRGN